MNSFALENSRTILETILIKTTILKRKRTRVSRVRVGRSRRVGEGTRARAGGRAVPSAGRRAGREPRCGHVPRPGADQPRPGLRLGQGRLRAARLGAPRELGRAQRGGAAFGQSRRLRRRGGVAQLRARRGRRVLHLGARRVRAARHGGGPGGQAEPTEVAFEPGANEEKTEKRKKIVDAALGGWHACSGRARRGGSVGGNNHGRLGRVVHGKWTGAPGRVVFPRPGGGEWVCESISSRGGHTLAVARAV